MLSGVVDELRLSTYIEYSNGEFTQAWGLPVDVVIVPDVFRCDVTFCDLFIKKLCSICKTLGWILVCISLLRSIAGFRMLNSNLHLQLHLLADSVSTSTEI